MPAPRSIATLLAAAALALPAGALAQSGGSGDSQYQDPFGPSSTSGKSSGSSSSSGSGGLSQSPNLGGGGSSTSSSHGTAPSSASGTAPAGTTSPAALPRTGTDPRLLVLAGLALLLAGIGLRLRTADEIF